MSMEVCKNTKRVSSPPEDDDDHRFVLKRRKLDSKSRAVLRDPELESAVFAFESASVASDYSDKRQAVEERLARVCSSEAALRGCGRLYNYERLEGIGRGSFGAVHRARDRRNGEIVAVKEQFDGMSVPTLREIDIFELLGSHDRIVQFKEVVADYSDGVYIVMACAERDLGDYMEAKAAGMTAGQVKAVMYQLFEGVRFMHRKRVMHRDIKPSNILVDSSGRLKICDFGLSRRIDAASGLYTPHVGTGWYKAPELVEGVKAYTEAVDMWAVGCVLAELLLRWVGNWEAGRLATICSVIGGDGGYDRLRSKFFTPEVVTGAGFELLKGLLCCEPSKRITAEEAVSHVWFEE